MQTVSSQGQPLASVFRQIGTGAYTPVVEKFERGKTIFFPGDPAERVYFLIKGAVKLSRVYEAGEEITVAGSILTVLHACEETVQCSVTVASNQMF